MSPESGKGVRDAILLIGPTGSGKTPLGEFFEEHGVRGQDCFHFDFGQRLRKTADGELDAGLSGDDLDVVRRVLKTGALLEDSSFQIAEKILSSELDANDGLVILNGLPRHEGQALSLEEAIHVQMVLCLDCSPEVVRDRIKGNTGGDRQGRTDDMAEDIERKLELFSKRTSPLIDYYRKKGSEIKAVEIGVTTVPSDIANCL
jgi:adenylate kinase